MDSRHDDCFQLKYVVGGQTQTLNLSQQQVKDYMENDSLIEGLVEHFIVGGMELYEKLLQEESSSQTEEG